MPLPKIQRDDSLTFIKFVAIALVVMVHTSAPGFVTPGPSWPPGLVYDSIAHVCVPLFFMVTGVLLLGKDHPVMSVLKRIWRVVVPLVVWSVLYLIWEQYDRGHVMPDWPLQILTAPYMHLWYLYALISVYVFLPLFSAFFQHATQQQKYWLLGVWFVGSSVLKLSDTMLGKPIIAIDLSFMPLYGGYMLLGAVAYDAIRARAGNGVLAAALVVWALGTLGVAWGSAYYMKTDGKFTMLFVDYWTPTVIVASAGAFVSLKLLYDRMAGAAWLRPCLDIGNRTFGIYLVHLMVLVFVLNQNDARFPRLTAWVSYPLAMVVTLVASWLIVAVAQRVRLLRLVLPM